MNCFWQKGYEATSMRDLAAQMGMTGPSLYNAFGDKRALFRQVLERYAEYSPRERIARLEATLPPRDAIRAFFHEVVERSLNDQAQRGCLLVNSAVEIAPHDPEIGAEIAARLDEIEAFFRRSVRAAQGQGAVSADRNPRDIAHLLLGVLLGIRVLARSTPRRSLLEGMLRPALALLDPPHPSAPRHPRKGIKR